MPTWTPDVTSDTPSGTQEITVAVENPASGSEGTVTTTRTPNVIGSSDSVTYSEYEDLSALLLEDIDDIATRPNPDIVLNATYRVTLDLSAVDISGAHLLIDLRKWAFGQLNSDPLATSTSLGSVLTEVTGSDKADFIIGTDGADTLNGGDGIDTVSYEYVAVSLADGIIADLSNNANNDDNTDDQHSDIYIATGDRFISIENLIGSQGDDTLTGDSGDNELRGRAGNDILLGGDGHDTLYGENGDDTLIGGDGHDRLYGGDGDDRLNGGDGHDILLGGDGDDMLIGGAGADWLNGGDGEDTASYEGSDEGVTVNLTVSRQSKGNTNDGTTNGHASNDTLVNIENLTGSGYDDVLKGDSENNVIIGNAGIDTLDGDDGDDILYGGGGDDTVTGGDGDDRFVLSADDTGSDTVTDFGTGSDKVRVNSTAGTETTLAALGLSIAASGSDAVIYTDNDDDGSYNSENDILHMTLQGFSASSWNDSTHLDVV